MICRTNQSTLLLYDLWQDRLREKSFIIKAIINHVLVSMPTQDCEETVKALNHFPDMPRFVIQDSDLPSLLDDLTRPGARRPMEFKGLSIIALHLLGPHECPEFFMPSTPMIRFGALSAQAGGYADYRGNATKIPTEEVISRFVILVEISGVQG